MFIRWDDGHESRLSLNVVRDACPCAGCKGETLLMHSYDPVPSPDVPGKFDLLKAEPVGYYALQLTWGDGHSTGIYTWQTLRSLCSCPVCSGGISS
ncbi:MAG: hypothetical protein A2X67_09410 [Ignavibacteria bacterium GWA2_55_11]|nr:MAG: hypothetical protein A2X67_09410 [Ignavibacteria bacterium GWA2_55_11]OGU46552.1 MAG: hypothetical protein A2X68_01240 [Ignavibacteria bacterium GWC2_56_12]OGU62360.1 MAG: hypothetical protein A3C56_05005 [Ignavibacteria bacterium RIFCSPHIGHO2_02_FULL_56_12]OGU74393.1 MAG: hypothetical protein A3G43_01780 [Ignavibacteria bacterium RIFCSPLOWO2_12_FULL_56_21]